MRHGLGDSRRMLALGSSPSFRHECQNSNLQGEACKWVADSDPLRVEVYSRMVSRRVFSMFLPAIGFASQILAQTVTPRPQPSPQEASESRIVAMTVPDDTPLQIALDKGVRVRKVGEPITGRVMQPVYVFDHLVIPVGTAATGRISTIDPVPGRVRTLSALNADFTPSHKLSVTFDELILPDGRHVDLHATIVPGSGQVIRLVSADEHKKSAVKDAAAQKMDQARAQWNNAMKQVVSPGKMHLVTRYAVARLPVHPQYIDAGTLYTAELSQPLLRYSCCHRDAISPRKSCPRRLADSAEFGVYA